MKRVTLFIILLFCSFIASLSAQEKPKENPYEKAKLSAVIINAADSTFGYDILMDGKTIIHQPSIPAMPGNKGFRTKADAEKTSELVIGKIRKGEMPPTLTVEELKKLKVIPGDVRK
jgi:hypothetical protein